MKYLEPWTTFHVRKKVTMLVNVQFHSATPALNTFKAFKALLNLK